MSLALSDSAKEARRNYEREYRKKNSEKLLEYHRNYEKNNPEKLKQYKINYWEKKASKQSEIISQN